MSAFTMPGTKPKNEVIEPRVGDTDNNTTNSDDVTQIQPTKVVTETKVVEKETVNDPNPWRDTQAVVDANTLTDVTGVPWVTNYYKGNSGQDDVTDVSSYAFSSVNQQFIKYNNMVLKVQGDGLQPETDPKTQITTAVGESIIQDVLKPSSGDHFTADLGEGRLGVLYVTEVQPLAIFKGRAYRIRYTLVELSDSELLELDGKVIQEYYCIVNGRSDKRVALTAESLQEKRNLFQQLRHHQQRWIEEFYSPTSYCFSVNHGDDQLHHDPLVADYARKTLNPNIYFADLVSVTRCFSNPYKSIFDGTLPTIPNRDFSILVKLVNTGINPGLHRVAYAGVDTVNYIFDYLGGVPSYRGGVTEQPRGKLSDIWQASEDTREIKLVPNPAETGVYPLAPDWYNSKNKTLLETQLAKLVDGTPLDVAPLAELLKASETTFTNFERYYFSPLIYVMVAKANDIR